MTDRPHVVAVVGNDITIDSRVRKAAATAAAAGYRSTIVCYTAGAARIEATFGDVSVVKVPVPFHGMRSTGRVNGLLRPFDGAELAARHVGPRTRGLARRRRLEAAGEHPNRLRWLRARLGLRHHAFRVRRRLHVTWDRGWKAFNLRWRRLTLKLRRPFIDPVANLLDYDLVLGPEIEALEPDIIHAHDHHMIGVAVTAARNLRRRGHPVKVLYDAHELVEGLSYPPRTIEGWLDEEAAHIDAVDAVTGVSPQQAMAIRERYGLAETPVPIMNAPVTTGASTPPSSLRADLGLGEDARILVYHGNVARERGVFTLLEAMPRLPADVHLAVVAPAGRVVDELAAEARRLDVDGRLHVRPFVPADQLPAYLSSADVAVIPYQRTGNNDIALPNKLFEAVQAGLPVVASDMTALSAFLVDHPVGRTFEAGSPEALADAVTDVLEHADTFRARFDDELRHAASWDAQAERLAAVYRRLVPVDGPATPIVSAADVEEDRPSEPASGPASPRLAVGPRNMAGQAFAIASAVQRHLGIPAVSFSMEKAAFGFPVHHQISHEQWRDPSWQLHQRSWLAASASHVLTESGTGPLGTMSGGFVDEQLPTLLEDGLSVGVLLHGSEIRDPRRHRHLPFSPYAVDDDLTASLERATERLRRHLATIDVPIFVTTPDLLEDVDATWLPAVVDPGPWLALPPPPEGIPVVLHLPSRGRLKGSEHVDPVLHRLDAAGRIRYLRPESPVAADEVARLIERAHIVIDGIVLGAYGVMSVQAMAAGRIAIANIRDLGSLREETPIVHADPSTLESTIEALAADRDRWPGIGDDGRAFAATYHDGSATADRLRPFLGLDR